MTALGRAVAVALRRLGLAWLVRHTLARRGVSVVLYHDPEPAALEAQLEWLRRHYHPITHDEMADALRLGRVGHLPPRSVVVNIDDGRAGNAALAEVLARHGVRPTLFLCSAIVGTGRGFWGHGLPRAQRRRLQRLPDRERLRVLAAEHDFDPAAERAEPEALSEEELGELAATCDFASHTRSHPILPMCDAATAWEEVAESWPEVEALTGGQCLHLAYPAGRYGAREAEMARRAGYLSARTVDTGWNRRSTDRYRLKVLSIDPPDVTMLAAELAGHKWLARLVNREGDLRGRRLA